MTSEFVPHLPTMKTTTFFIEAGEWWSAYDIVNADSLNTPPTNLRGEPSHHKAIKSHWVTTISDCSGFIQHAAKERR